VILPNDNVLYTLCRPSRAHDDASLLRCTIHRSDEDASYSGAHVQPCGATAARQDGLGQSTTGGVRPHEGWRLVFLFPDAPKPHNVLTVTLSMMGDSMRKKSEVSLLGISSSKNNTIMGGQVDIELSTGGSREGLAVET
jgi:hypothetical protein